MDALFGGKMKSLLADCGTEHVPQIRGPQFCPNLQVQLDSGGEFSMAGTSESVVPDDSAGPDIGNLGASSYEYA